MIVLELIWYGFCLIETMTIGYSNILKDGCYQLFQSSSDGALD